MGKLPHIPAKKVVQKLKRAGFVETHQRGSHLYLEKEDRVVTVAMHGSKNIPPGTLHSIVVRQAGMTVEEFLKL